MSYIIYQIYRVVVGRSELQKPVNKCHQTIKSSLQYCRQKPFLVCLFLFFLTGFLYVAHTGCPGTHKLTEIHLLLPTECMHHHHLHKKLSPL